MDILSILALSKANKALKNGGGGTTESSIVYYEFTVTYNIDTGYYTVTSTATVSAILKDITDGKMPVAIIHQENNNDMFAYVREYADDDVFFVTMPNVTQPQNTLWCDTIDYDSHDDMWNYGQIPVPGIQ